MHYLSLTFIAVVAWSSLALLAAKLTHVPAFFLLACCLFIGGSLSVRQWRHWQLHPKLLLVGVGGIFGYHFLLFMALRLAPPVTANLLNYLWPLLILLFTPVFFRQVSLTKRQVIGAVISLMGAGLIVSGNGSAESREFSFEHLLGYSFAVLAAITWACYSLLTKKLTQEYNQFGSATVGLFCLLSSVLAMVVHYALEQSPVISSADIGLMFILGLGPLGLSFYCWDAALKKGDPRVIATLSYFTPLLSTLLLITVGGKNFNQEILLAMCLITFGALVANLDLRVLVRCYQGIFPEK